VRQPRHTFEQAYLRSEDRLGRSWPLWAAAIFVYVGFAYVLLTRVTLRTPLHLLVFVMAFAIMIITVLRVDWAVLGLTAMIAFSRPGFTVGPTETIHISGFNLALVGVWIVYVARYFVDRELAAKGPILRRTALDPVITIYLILVTISFLSGLNINSDPYAKSRVILYYKEQLLYFLWFYLLISHMRTPQDIRRVAIVFASSGLLVGLIGIWQRVTGAAQAVGLSAGEMQEHYGMVDLRTSGAAGGFLGLGHPNFMGAFLLTTVPFWLFAVEHLKRAMHKLVGQAGVVMSLLALLFTYSRSAWGGLAVGVAAVGFSDRKALLRIVLMVVIFAVVAQLVTLAQTGFGVVDILMMRFEQLERSGFSGRPAIFEASRDLIERYPLTGVGPGAYPWHAVSHFHGRRLLQGHNLLLTIASEMGLPAAIAYLVMIVMLFTMVSRSLRRVSHVPGYGFLVQGAFVALFAVITQSLFVHLFHHKDVGYSFYVLVALIVAIDRMVREGRIPPAPESLPASSASATWAG